MGSALRVDRTPTTSSPSRAGPATASTIAARIGLVLAMVLSGATLILVGFTRSGEMPSLASSHLHDSLLIVAFVPYAVLGSIVLTRRPENRVGWVFLVSGLCLLVWAFSFRYAVYGLLVRPGSLLGAGWLAWISRWLIVPGFGSAFVLLPLLFPDGRLPSRWHRTVVWFAAFAISLTSLAWATFPGPSLLGVPNPVGLTVVEQLRLNEVGWGLLVLAVLASVVSMVVRYVRSVGTERLQLQWFAYAVVAVGLTFVTLTIGSDWEPASTAAAAMFPVAAASIPAAAFVAIFKHDLYDLEVVVSKTITFGVLAALITGVYVLIVAGLGSLVGSAGEPNLALAVLATALVAVAFQPARTWAQRLARRLVYGQRANPYEVLAEFAHRIGNAPNPEEILSRMARLVAEGTGAVGAGVWLVVGGELHRVACWPPDPGRRVAPIGDDGLSPLPEASHAVEVRRHDRFLGAISMTLPTGQTLSPTEHRLVADLGAQAVLVFDNIRLIEELKASRQRIVTAQDQERHRLEQNIHDGIQQRLLAHALALRTGAAAVIGAPDEAMSRSLDAAADEARAILTELRRLARGIHPAIVTEGGLVAALESLAERSPIPAEVHTSDLGNLPLPIEITVYYLAAEGLANATKHADASSVTITAERTNGEIRVEVVDDGIGGADPTGTGLTGLADRVAALGGNLVVASPPDGGTRLQAEVPCG